MPVDLLDLTPTEDTPTVTSGAHGASALASAVIASSPGWLREKRVGVAETAAGAAQTSTAALDLTGSSRFRYSPLPGAVVGHTANAGNYVWSDFKPGSTATVQNAKWLFPVVFTTSSPQVAFRFRAPVANPRFGMVRVNGRRISESATPTTNVTSGGGGFVLLTFPDARPRLIDVRGLITQEGDFGGVAVASGYTVVKPTPTITRRVAFLTDSYGNGAGTYPDGAANVETFVWRLGALMGADEILQAGIGGTGWVTTLSGQPTSNFAGRISLMMSTNPQVVVLAGGRNDAQVDPATLQAAVESSLDAIGTGVERWVVRTSANTSTAANTAIAAGCATRGVPYLDIDVDSIPKISDGIHPTYAGHQQYADMTYAAMTPATPPQGSTSGAFAYAGSATGVVDRSGATIGDYVYTGSAAGSSTRSGTASGVWESTGAADGATIRTSTATGVYAYEGAATGATTRTGTGAGTLAYDDDATGQAPVVGGASGAGTGSFAYSGTATGTTTRSGAATVTYTYTGSATGNAPTLDVPDGVTVGGYSFTGTATGAVSRTGISTATYIFSGTATGTTTRAGNGPGAYAYAGSAVGYTPIVHVHKPADPNRTTTITTESRVTDVGFESRFTRA